MPWYPRILAAIKLAAPSLCATQAVNLALLVSALLARRTLCLSGLARAYPVPDQRRVSAPKHNLLHRLKRLWRFLDNDRVDPLAVQAAFIPHVVVSLGRPRWLGIIVDWTMFDTVLPCGRRVRYQVVRLAVPRAGRALPLLQLAYDRDHLPADTSQNQLEERALQAVMAALPPGVRPVVLADRGFARASLFTWLQAQHLDFVIRIDRGTCLTEPDGRRWRLGQEGLAPGQVRWVPEVRYGLHHDRPRDLTLNVALCWQAPQPARRRAASPAAPWYLATSLDSAPSAAAWYRQRWWIEASFKDSKSGFGLDQVQVACPARLSRLLLGLTLALAWLLLAALPTSRWVPPGWQAALSQWGRVSRITLALALLDEHRDLPPACLPAPA